MNKPKFYYDNGMIIFFTDFQGNRVELLKVKIETMDFKLIQHYRDIAQVNLNEFLSSMRLVKQLRQAA